MFLINIIRSIFRIRIQRGLAAPGPLPQVGSSIVLDNLKIKLKHPINIEQWHWFSKLGWRTVNMRVNRRKYIGVPDHVLEQLLDADKSSRDALYRRLVIMHEKSEQPSNHALQNDTV